jgi:hypothetical protein
MSIRTLLTKERSAERWIIGCIGVGALAYAALQVVRAQYGVAIFLCGAGLLALAASLCCTDKTLRTIGLAAILVNISAGILALLGG